VVKNLLMFVGRCDTARLVNHSLLLSYTAEANLSRTNIVVPKVE